MHLIGGVESDHDLDRHRVTGCIHTHEHCHNEGKIRSGANMSSQMTQIQMQKQQQDAQFSLSSWLQRMLNSGKSILKGIWGTNDVNADGAAGDRTGSAQLMAQVGDNAASDSRGAVNSHAAVEQNAAIHGNPYFSTMQEKNVAAHMTPFQRVRAKIVSGAEKLAGKLPGKSFRFQAKNSFQAKSDHRSKEDLRKRSKYRKDELEIDCILTDESYLMDSYDRKGEYSQLTTKK